jgi:hypothetical protein
MLAVDQNGNGNVAGDQIGVTVLGGGKLNLMTGFLNSASGATGNVSLNDVVGHGQTISGHSTWDNGTATKFGMSLTTLSKNFDTPSTNEVLDWRVASQSNSPYVTLEHSSSDYTGPMENSSNIYSDYRFTTNSGDSTNYYGMTDYGVLVKKYVPTGSNPVTLTLSYPESQVFGQVFVTAGAVTAQNGSSSVSTETVNPIAVGLAVLDKDAPQVGSENMIVVGGPCANTVAAALMGNPTDCAAGFTPGKAIIQSFENNGKVAILVAGYEAQETLGASYVLANYKDYAAFKGSEVEVVVPDLKNIVVQAVSTPAPAMDNTTNMTQ